MFLVRTLSFGWVGGKPAVPAEVADAEARLKGMTIDAKQQQAAAQLRLAAAGGDAAAVKKYVDFVDGLAAPHASEEAFADAQARMKGASGVSNEDKLALYALFKQATVGQVNVQRPNPLTDYVGAAKWNAWNRLGSLDQPTARARYVALAGRLAPPAAPAGPSGAGLAETFEQAVERSKLMPSKPSQDDQLRMYALFKQAKEGPCRSPKPGMFDIVGQAKWSAWTKLGGMTKEQAMETYVQLVDSLGAPPLPAGAAKQAEEPADDSGPALPRDVETARRHSERPTLDEVSAHQRRSNELAYGAERLAAFGGKRPLDLFDSPYDVLRWRAAKMPDRRAYTHLEDGEREGARLTYGELDRKSQAIAVALAKAGCGAGGRVLLLYPQNLEFVATFFGCLYAGAIAVPSYPPHPARLHRLLPRLLGIIDDCKPAVIATTREIKDMAAMLADQVPQLKTTPMLATDEVSLRLADEWQKPALTRDTVAFLQYTSGSTSTPKGVMVTHFNLVFNLEIFRVAGEMDENEVGVSWCPEFHDLGLIAGILCPCYLGFPLYLMSPEHFLQKPSRWVEMMSKYRGTFSGGPNFAYDLAVRKTPAAVRQRVDLSAWRIAFCGAEPVKISTAVSFRSAFPTFPAATFYPGWGLAEATLIIANTLVGRPPSHILLSAEALARHQVQPATDDDIRAGTYRSIVSQGTQWLTNQLLVMDPDTFEALPAHRVGELIVQGPTVGRGYWGKPEETEAAFGVVVKGREADGKWLRTGDYGFIHPNGEVFICGRSKDVLIVAGVNHYPQDIELTCEACSAVLRKGCGAAFSLDTPQGEQVAVLFEIDKTRAQSVDLKNVAVQMSGAIADVHGVVPAVVGLIPPQAVSKTTSGKIQRRATKAAYLAGETEILAECRSPAAPPPPQPRKDEDAEEIHDAEDDDIVEFVTPPDSPTADDSIAQVHQPPPPPRPHSPAPKSAPPVSPQSHSLRTPSRRHLAPIRLPTPLSSPGTSPKAPGTGRYTHRDCAIVGIGCKLPGGVMTPEQLWDVLKEEKCVCGKVPEGRWPPGHAACEFGAFLDDVRSFDHSFFGMSDEEAALVDPQQRLLLEVVQEALDDGCLSAPRLQALGPVGCFVGISQQEYSRVVEDAGQTGRAVEVSGVSGPNDKAMAASRVAAHFGFRGAARSVDTACSSSLVAVHDACAALSRKECRSAVVAGANLMLTPDISAAFEHAGFLASDGLCKTFDANADGYVRGEGVCAVVIKLLDDAVADGDRIYACVKGSAVNQDGKSNGLTAPNGAAQEAVIKSALESARVDPRSVQYVEAHGTGTALGDPIELKSLRAALGEGHLGVDCRVGSAKTNFGHLESAAGMLGFIKVALCLHNRQIPASLHYSSPNPHAIFVDRALQKRLTGWPRPNATLVAGVSSFGFGGTNAHAVLCEAPRRSRRPAQPPPTCNTCYCLPVSHPSGGERLGDARDALARSLSKCDDARAVQLCAAAALRRGHYAVRNCVTGFTREELLEALRGKVKETAVTKPKGQPRVGFVFSGQGPQWYGMGRRLLHKYTSFHETLKVIDDLFMHAQEELAGRYPHVPHFSVMDQFLCEEDDSLLRETFAAQVCVFSLQVALAALLKSFGIVPAAVVGHSLGELAAAVVSGALPLGSAVRIVLIRGAIMQKAAGLGKMAAVQLQHEGEAAELLSAEPGGGVVLAARNAPTHVTISGDTAGVAKVVAAAQARGLWVRELPVNYAFHSPQMAPLAAELQRELQAAGYETAEGSPACTFYSTAVAGATNPTLDDSYWSAQVLKPVCFSDAIAKMEEDGVTHLVEISPHPVLRDSMSAAAQSAAILHCLHRETDEERSIKSCAAQLYEAGADVQWEGLTGVKPRDCGYVRLPRTAWRRGRHWVRDARTLYVDMEPGISSDLG